jgi:hypothetical protein
MVRPRLNVPAIGADLDGPGARTIVWTESMPHMGERRQKSSTPVRSHRASRRAQRAGPLQAFALLTSLCALGYVAWSIGWSRRSASGLSRAALVDVGVLIVGLSLLSSSH